MQTVPPKCFQTTSPFFSSGHVSFRIRQFKNNLQSRFRDLISHLLNQNGLPPDVRSALSTSHTQSVEHAIAQFPLNRVLNAEPYPIHPGEQLVLRSQQSSLAQLRSSFCSALRSYQSRIGIQRSPSFQTVVIMSSQSTIFRLPCFPPPHSLLQTSERALPLSSNSYNLPLPLPIFLYRTRLRTHHDVGIHSFSQKQQ